MLGFINRLRQGFTHVFSAVALFALCGLSGCGGGSTSEPPEPVRISVDFFGDSLWRGLGVDVSLVQQVRIQRPEWAVGDYTAVGLLLRSLMAGYEEPYVNAPAASFPLGPQPPFEAVKRNGRFTVISLGGNDAYSLSSVEQFEKELRQAIAIVQSEGRVPVLTGIPGVPVGDVFNQSVIDRCKEMNQVTLDVAEELRLPHARWADDYRGPSDTIDGIHRTQEASDRLATLLIKTIGQVAL